MQKINRKAQTLRVGLFGVSQKLFNETLNLIFPARCVGCGRVDYPWCPRCENNLLTLPLDPIGKCIEGISILSTGIHDGLLQNTIHALKYDQFTDLCPPLARRLIRALTQLNWQFDLIVPVPLHQNRLAQRGYNQSQLIAQGVAQKMNIECLPTAISRFRDTPTQVGLNKHERLQNVKDAFIADAQFCSGRSILLIDDVLTTGATLVNCAQAAKHAGAQHLLGLTVTVARSP